MKKVCLTLEVALLIAFLPILANGQPGDGPKAHRMMQKGMSGQGMKPGAGMLLRLKDKLGLDANQVDLLNGIMADEKGKLKAGNEAVKAEKEVLQKAAESGASEAEIRLAASELGNALGDQAVIRAGLKSKIDGILTEAQKTKLKELKAQHTEKWKMEAGEGKRKGGPGGEWAGPARDPEAMFKRIDTNGDRTVSLEEFKAHMEQMKKFRGGRGMPAPAEPDEDMEAEN